MLRDCQTGVMDSGQSLATGGNFYELRNWTDAQRRTVRDAIKAQNAKDKTQRSTV